MSEVVTDFARQSPLVVLVLVVAWWVIRFVKRQHDRELAGKDAEIRRLLDERQKEIDRLVRERRWMMEMVLQRNGRGKKISDGE